MVVYLAMIDLPEEKSKFERVYQAYQNLMFYVANSILGNEQDAEDAVHNAFLKIAENLDKIGDVMCPKTKSYIVTIVENKAIDLYRSNKRKKGIVPLDDLPGIAVEAQEVQGLEDCILRLPARYREVILLKYYHGFTTKEIATQLGISEANASKLDQRAKHRLQQICQEEGIL